MTSIARTIAFAAALTAVLLCAGTARSSSASDALLARMTALNANLKSYTAAVHADITMRTFPFLSPSLDGTYYHKEPSKDKLVFTSGLPAIAKQFSKIYPHIDSPANWNAVFVVTTAGDDGTMTTFKLVPRKQGRIDHIDVKVDDKLATIAQMRWTYNDGGYATMSQQYAKFGDNDYLVTQQTGHVEVPHYTVDVKSTFSGFALNAPIPDSVFTEN